MAVIVCDDAVLLAHRRPDRRWYPDCWDVVGGHLEPGEKPAETVVRECREELAIEVSRVCRVEVDLEDPALLAHVFVVTEWSGSPVNTAPEEHDAIAWFGVGELQGLQLADPSYRDWLPRIIVSTSAPRDGGSHGVCRR